MKPHDHYSPGKKFLEDGRFEDALAYFDKVLKEHPNDPDILNGKGVALRSLGRYDEALKYFDLSLHIDPRDKNSS